VFDSQATDLVRHMESLLYIAPDVKQTFHVSLRVGQAAAEAEEADAAVRVADEVSE